MAEKMYFGVPGNIQEIPAPKSGMGFDSNTDVEVTNLVNGGRSVYRAPTAYKTFNMTWQTSSDRLRHLIDLYNGQFGPGPFYISDPTANQENVLPARWSSSWQLAHQSNGWCRPIIDTDDGIPVTPMPTVYNTNRYVIFKQVAAGANVKLEGVVRTRLIRIPGKGYYLSVAGSATGGAAIKVRGFSSATNTWTVLTTFTTFTGATVNVLADTNTNITMLELDLYMPLGSTLTLKGMALGTVDHSAVLNVLRTNRLLNPAPTSTTGFAATGGVGTWTYSTAESDPFARFTKDATVATTAFYWGAAVTAPIGTVVSFNFWIRSSAAVTITLRNAGTAFTVNATRALTANTWTQVSYEAYVTTIADFRLAVLISNMAASSTLDFKKGIVEFASTVGNYFTGSTPDSHDLDRYYRWTGTANNSTSVETDEIPTDWMPVGQGIGAVQFGDSTGGELVSSAIDRIGLSLDFTEVQNVESLML